MIKVYLSGGTKHEIDGGNRWRNNLIRIAQEYEHPVKLWNPNSHFNYTYLPPVDDKECMALFYNALKMCDVVVVNLKNTAISVGTGMEIAWAKQLGKPIIGFNNENSYPWISECCDVIFDTGCDEDILIYISEHYRDLVG